MFYRRRLILTGSNSSKQVSTWSNMLKHAQTCFDRFQHVQTCSDWFLQVLTVFNGLKLLQTGFDRFHRVQTCSNMFSIVVFRHQRRRTLRLPSLVPDDDERLEFSAVDVVEVAKVVVNVVRARHLTAVTSNKLERKKKYNFSLQWALLKCDHS